jgi:hypothetical protein
MPGPIGPKLNDEWNIGVVQSLFSVTGTWFNRLVQFPAALCDPYGYIRFENEIEYLNCVGIKIGKRTNVASGISQLRQYVRAN